MLLKFGSVWNFGSSGLREGVSRVKTNHLVKTKSVGSLNSDGPNVFSHMTHTRTYTYFDSKKGGSIGSGLPRSLY